MLALIWSSFKRVGGHFFTVIEILLALFLPSNDTHSLKITYKALALIAIALALLFAIIFHLLYTASKSYIRPAKICNSRCEGNTLLLFAEFKPTYATDALVTIYKTTLCESVQSKKPIHIETPIAIGFVRHIQSGKIIQIQVLDYLPECKDTDKQELEAARTDIIKQVSIRPYAHMSMIKTIEKEG